MARRGRRTLARSAILLFALVCIIGIAASAGTTSRPDFATDAGLRPGAGQRDVLARASGVALGVAPDGPTLSAVRRFVALAGARPAVIGSYHGWGERLLEASELRALAGTGAAPLITWDPIIEGRGLSLAAIAAGRFDSIVRGAAADARAYKKIIYIRFGHEMNLEGSPFGTGHPGDDPASYVAAWRHVVTIFRRRGAINVRWVFSPNVECGGACPFVAYYPGDSWVDWVALDGYNYGAANHDAWLSFEQLFAPSYAVLTRLSDKPMMIAETASTELGGDKAQWISQIGSALESEFPRVRLVVWFQRVKETDWRVNSSAASLAAFRHLVSSAPFARLSPGR